MDHDDVARLTALEESLWRPATRFDREHLDEVLADDFEEFGASGRHRTRATSMGVPARPSEARPSELRLRALGAEAVLLTCRSEIRWPGEDAVLVARRSSVRQRSDGAWRLRFHQGTPLPG